MGYLPPPGGHCGGNGERLYRLDTQLGRLQLFFKSHAHQWISMAHLVQVSGSFVIHSKVAELRKAGMWIENECSGSREAGGAVISRYRYLPELDLLTRGKFDIVFIDARGQKFDSASLGMCLYRILLNDGVLVYHTEVPEAVARMGWLDQQGRLVHTQTPQPTSGASEKSKLFFYADHELAVNNCIESCKEHMNDCIQSGMEHSCVVRASEILVPGSHRRLFVGQRGAPEGWSHAPLNIFESILALQPRRI